MLFIERGIFIMGIDELVFLVDGEGSVRKVIVYGFYLDKYEVSNVEF